MNLDALLEAGARYQAAPCIIGQTLDALPEPYKTALTTQLKTKSSVGGFTDYDITNRMRLAGFKASETSVNRHRNERCTCPFNSKETNGTE